MAQATKTDAEAQLDCRMRKSALKAARGAALAAHSAGGIASRCNKEAERLLRTAEGLCRAAAALLELPPISTNQSRGSDSGQAATASAKQRKKRNRRKAKGKKEAIMEVEDGLVEEQGAGVALVGADSPSQPRVGSLDSGPTPRRTLKANSSRERSPRRGVDPPSASVDASCSTPAVCEQAPFVPGDSVTIHGLTSKPELNGLVAEVVSWCSQRQRFAIKLPTTSEQVWTKRDNLLPLPGAASPSPSPKSSLRRDATPFEFGPRKQDGTQ